MANPSNFSGRPNLELFLNISTSGATVNWALQMRERVSQPTFSGFPADNKYSYNFSGGGGPSVSNVNFTYDFSPAGLQTLTLASGSFTATQAFTATASADTSNTLAGDASVDQFVSPSFPPPPPPPSPVWSTGTTLSTATRGSAYSATVTASPVTSYSVVAQSADTRGLSASGNTISGTPTSTGTVTFTIRANNSGSTADRTFSITINPALPVFSDSSVATAVRNSSYTDGVTASETASYSLRNPENTGAGNLPSGLNLNTSTGAITGTPSTVGNTQFRVRATNVTGFTDTGIITLTVNPIIPEFTDSAVASTAIVGTVYSDGVAATETASYSVFSGILPPGISLNTTTGEITSSPGTPTTAGIFTFVIRATNVTGSTNTGTLTITVISGAKVWNGTAFVAGTTRVWDGTSFVSSTTRVWNGSAWVSST